MEPIPDHVKLPLNVPARIVMQGLRIRLGRSVITVCGVLLGIMFLSSTMTTHIVREGVAGEDALRAETTRMGNFLAAELGLLRGRSIGIIAEDDLSESEQRLVRHLQRENVARIGWHGVIPPALQGLGALVPEDLSESGHDHDAIIVMNSNSPASKAPSTIQALNYPGPVFVTGVSQADEAPRAELRTISLSGRLTDEEAAQRKVEAATAQYRLIWILAIALVVTMMGITNAMLMSVTERFREIGTMKCLGATSQLIRRIFLIESLLVGGTGSIFGAVLGVVFSVGFHGIIYGMGIVIGSLALGSIALTIIVSTSIGVALTVLAALYPASVASAMVPANALRSNV